MVSATWAVWLTAPAVPVEDPVIVKVACTGGFTGWPGPEHPARRTSMSIAATIPTRSRSRLVLGSKNNSIIAKSSGTTCRIETGGMRIEGGGSIIAVVVTVTCAVCAVTPSAAVTGVTTVQVVPLGAPVQVSATAWLNPPCGVMVTLKFSGAAAVTVSVAGAVTVKSHPVPVSGTVCGLPPALSVIVSVPVRAPSAVGANVTLIVQVFDPAVAGNVAGLIGQAPAPVLVAAKSPEAAIVLIVNGPNPVFVSVTVFAALVVVSICPPKARFAGASPTPGAVADPVPLRPTLND
jgi:hypothetical protein